MYTNEQRNAIEIITCCFQSYYYYLLCCFCGIGCACSQGDLLSMCEEETTDHCADKSGTTWCYFWSTSREFEVGLRGEKIEKNCADYASL